MNDWPWFSNDMSYITDDLILLGRLLLADWGISETWHHFLSIFKYSSEFEIAVACYVFSIILPDITYRHTTAHSESFPLTGTTKEWVLAEARGRPRYIIFTL